MAATRAEAGRFASELLAWAGAYLISTVGLVHLLQAEEMFGAEIYLGLSFLANFLICAVAAVVLARDGSRWAWLLGAGVCALTIAGFLASRTLGLPGYEEAVGQWLNFPALVVTLVELTFLGVCPLALTRRGRSVVEREERALEREAERPPAPSPEQLERQMDELRSRMDPGLGDLRVRMNPRTVEKRGRRGLRRRLRGIFGHRG